MLISGRHCEETGSEIMCLRTLAVVPFWKELYTCLFPSLFPLLSPNTWLPDSDKHWLGIRKQLWAGQIKSLLSGGLNFYLVPKWSSFLCLPKEQSLLLFLIDHAFPLPSLLIHFPSLYHSVSLLISCLLFWLFQRNFQFTTSKCELMT